MKNFKFIFVCLLFFISSSEAADYYVAVTGSDTNIGSSASPFRSIQHAYNVSYFPYHDIHDNQGMDSMTVYINPP